MKNALAFSENLIYFFKVKPVGLWEEEIHTYERSQIDLLRQLRCLRLTWQYQEKVRACEDQKVPPPNGRESGRRDFGYHETMKGQQV